MASATAPAEPAAELALAFGPCGAEKNVLDSVFKKVGELRDDVIKIMRCIQSATTDEFLK